MGSLEDHQRSGRSRTSVAVENEVEYDAISQSGLLYYNTILTISSPIVGKKI